MRATILFPGDYFSLNSPNDNFIAELDAVVACDGLDSLLFNYDEYIEGAPLLLSKPAAECAKLLIYRGWMMKPEQYERLYGDLSDLGFDVLTDPLCYERMHCFPNAGEMFEGQTPRFRTYPAIDGRVNIDAEEVNGMFGRFMVKDYVKSAKKTSFPTCIETPVTQEELDGLIEEFVRLRGELFTGGIVLKDFVDLKRYGKATNEWREFRFLNGVRLALARNSSQPASCPKPPDDYVATRNIPVVPFYTVDYAELEDGSWTIIEAGDGGVSGLAAADSATRFYEKMADVLGRIYPVPEGVHALDYGVFNGGTKPDDVREWLSGHREEPALAYCYAFADNQWGSTEHEASDPVDSQNPYPDELCDAWFELTVELFGRIDAILESEGVRSGEEGMCYRVAPFMARNGYSDGCGWWVAE